MRSSFVMLLACIACSRCTGSRIPGPVVIESGDPSITVIGSAALRGRTVLDAIEMHVPDITIDRHSGECPHIRMRAARSLPTEGRVAVYVDGAPAPDTCVFDRFGPGEVERVEIFPGGVTSAPGYARNVHGLILIFRRL